MMTFDEAHVATELVTDRRSSNQRVRGDRRTVSAVVSDLAGEGEERRSDDGEPRRKVVRRRQIDPTTCERDYGDAQVEFMTAMDLYKRRSGRQFPTWSEVLEVIESLGYRKVAEPKEIEL